jgi:hypothetical protein
MAVCEGKFEALYAMLGEEMERGQIDQVCIEIKFILPLEGHHGHDHMVVGFTTTYEISAYHH